MKHHECVTSSEFLRSLQTQKQGDCPPPQKASGFAAACVEGCAVDRECTGFKKCCSNGCGHTCQTPGNLYKGVPLKPRRDIFFSEDQHGHLEVMWMSKFNVSVEPVLYILQKRWNHGIHPSEDEASSWHTVLMTMEERSVLKDIRPHRWYQFRVSAVNSQGTRGFTTPSKHFFSTRDPFPPENPQNGRTGNQTMNTDGTVNVMVLWDAPRESDLAVHHYKVTCSLQGTPSSSQIRAGRVTDGGVALSVYGCGKFISEELERKLIQIEAVDMAKSRCGYPKSSFNLSLIKLNLNPQRNKKFPQVVLDVTEMEFQSLQPNTQYRVQIQAISYWGQKRLKSSRAQLSFTTAAVTTTSSGHISGKFSNELPLSHTSASILRLEAAAPHYHDNQLQVKVFWKSRTQGK
ncbi:Anosmin-1 [Triplophysa tibetana]|uniref:Anosmin-1 n=1 Tax=Triplophysa tibetana TaxID=1572043 RepID=A0A5A9NU85_9TELE|nr:Anosmin-1 [Triplophysa tibetana]